MGRIVVANFVSIDGVVQSPLSPEEDRDGGFDQGGWVARRPDDTVDAVMQAVTVDAAALLLGRRSYDILAGAWAEADDADPAVAAMNRMPKHVVTSSRGRLAWTPASRLDTDLPRSVAEVRDRTEGDLVVLGSGRLVRGLAAHDLVDAYRLLLYPVVLGSGKRMFDDGARPSPFALTNSTVTDTGVAILTYEREPRGRR